MIDQIVDMKTGHFTIEHFDKYGNLISKEEGENIALTDIPSFTIEPSTLLKPTIIYTPRTIANAMRCQLLTGSYDGALRSCDCLKASYCRLTKEERDDLESHPKVKEALERNYLDYNRNRTQKPEGEGHISEVHNSEPTTELKES